MLCKRRPMSEAVPDRPPDEIKTPALVLQRFRRRHVAAVTEAINRSLDHLRPWMAWAREPVTEAAEEKVLVEAEAHFEEGSEFAYVMLDQEANVVGTCGLHRRGPADTLEIGYWVHADHVNRGIATAAAGALTDVALAMEGIAHVEIHCDARNAASAAVPRKLGYELVSVVDDPERGEGFQEMVWRFTPGSATELRR
jgi:RimJ/RimL family protein N-acetyltransferase